MCSIFVGVVKETVLDLGQGDGGWVYTFLARSKTPRQSAFLAPSSFLTAQATVYGCLGRTKDDLTNCYFSHNEFVGWTFLFVLVRYIDDRRKDQCQK